MNTLRNDQFTQRVQTVYDHTETLYESIRQSGIWQNPQLIISCLEELRLALEQLQVAEEELRQQNEALVSAHKTISIEQQRYRDLFEFAPDGYVVTDLHGVVREANRIAAAMLNIEQKYLLGKPLVNFIPESHRRSFRLMLNQLPTIQRVQEWELLMRRRSGETFNAALTVETVYDMGRQPTGLRWLMRDITARKQAEAQLQQIQLQNLELLETDRLKNQFIANISHELRTPLNAILGFTELMQRYVEQQNSEQQNASQKPYLQLSGMVERIFRNGRHLLALIEEMLDFSRLKAERLKLNVEPLDIVELVRQVVEETRPLADQKALEIRVDAVPECIAVVNDPIRLRQILVNLLSNAIKFTDKGSVIVEVAELPDEKIVLMVQDTGIGIAEADLPHIFSEFWQVNSSTTRSQGGTGLGLAIVRAIVELMQGCISVDSQLDHGTTVRIEIPQWLFIDAPDLLG